MLQSWAAIDVMECPMPSGSLRRRPDGGLLRRLLEDPELAPTLRALPAATLRQVILRVGLEDAGELIALASFEQLRDVFDEDLWRSPQPGQDEAFDATRFVIWLEVLLEAGDRFVADRLAEMSEEFLVFALSQLVRVLDVTVVSTWAGAPGEAERLDQILDGRLHHELDEYLLIFRGQWGWDAIVTTLLALDQHHPHLLRGVLARCALATNEQVTSAEMLSSVLEGEAVLLEDARAEREDRRGERGYISPADARAFLSLARTPLAQPELDPITRIYFRERKPQVDPSSYPSASDEPGPRTPLRQLLTEAADEPDAYEVIPSTGSLFTRTLREMLDEDGAAHQRLIEELAYLANVLIAGDTSGARGWRPGEAAERVLVLCDEGLRSITKPGEADARAELERWGAVGVFRMGWAAQAGSA
jgi:hypothetical protein